MRKTTGYRLPATGYRLVEESTMRLERLDGEESTRTVGAAVVRAVGSGEIVLELGPADGPPLVRLTMSHTEAIRLASATQAVVQSGGESILIADD